MVTISHPLELEKDSGKAGSGFERFILKLKTRCGLRSTNDVGHCGDS